MSDKAPFAGSAHLLNLHFDRRRESFSGLSKRWLAQKMKISPSFLTMIFKGEKALPFHRVAELRELLNMDTFAARELHFQILREMGLDQDILSNIELLMQKDLLQEPGQATAEHELNKQEHVFLLEQWYYLPLLDLVSTLDFRDDPTWIAGRLGISEAAARSAWDLLVRAALVQLDQGRWRRSQLKLRFPVTKADPRIQKFHAMMLEKVRGELVGSRAQTGFDSRLILSATSTGSPESFEKAQRFLQEALARAVNLLEDSAAEDVYTLTIGLVPLT